MEGEIIFRDNEVFHGEWAPNGVTIIGHLIKKNGEKIRLRQENLVWKGDEVHSSKIIYYNKGCFYEGGLYKHHYDSKGFFYSNFQHPFYFESNYRNKKFNGRYIYHSIYYGFETEEHYINGKEKGVWKYKTDRGYEYSGDTATKK